MENGPRLINPLTLCFHSASGQRSGVPAFQGDQRLDVRHGGATDLYGTAANSNRLAQVTWKRHVEKCGKGSGSFIR